MIHFSRLVGALCMAGFASHAGLVLASNERNEVPSCYASLGLKAPSAKNNSRDLVIIVDKTVVFPKDIVIGAIETAQRFIKSGDRISVYSFSAFVPGQYMDMEWAGSLENKPSPDEEEDIPVMKIKRLERCLSDQVQFASKSLGNAVMAASKAASNDIPKSEIIFSLRKLGNDMQARDMRSPRVLLLSDMLENSDYFTFYSGNKVAVSDPEKALQNLHAQGLFGNLVGAQVYVSGAGTVTPGIMTTYRSGALIDKLETFWGRYFEKSNAKLKAFGAPKLLSDLN